MEKLRVMLRKIIEEESKLECIEIKGESLDAALEEACQKLGISLSELDYEIMESGDGGILGFGKKKYKIRVYKTRNTLDMLNQFENENKTDGLDIDLENQLQNRDGEAFVRIVESGVWLKVTAPVLEGIPISEEEVFQKLERRGISDYEGKVVKSIVQEAKGEYQKIGHMPMNVINDASATVQISESKMKAYITIVPPKAGGYDLELDQIRSILKNNGVIVGIKEDALNSIIDYPEYEKPILIAEGIKVINGTDAQINYHFNTSKKREFQEHNGQVDFKSINNIQNVVAGQTLATKIPATEGTSGRLVDGEMVYNKPGKDIVLQEGKNTQVTEDGMHIVATTNGQVSLNAGKVNVDEIYIVQGDVNLKTGHIVFLGNVVITGSVEDNFNVTAEGNIEIKGSVGKCRLEAEGNIIVSQGIMGKDEAYIRAGGSLYAKFVQQVSKVEVGDSVYVQDAIMQSYVDATKEICCVGKRATIVGGDLRAGELIKSGTIGSLSGTETIIEVGIDPKRRQQLMELTSEQENAYKQLEQVEVNFNGLKIQRKQMKDKFPKEKEELYKSLSEEINKYNEIIKSTTADIEEINKYLIMLKSKGHVIATKIVYPQVKIYIKNAMLPIRTEYKKVQFELENEEVGVVQYNEEKSAES